MLQPCRRVHQFVRLRQLETVAERIGKSERHIAVAETGDIPRIGIMRLGAIEQDAKPCRPSHIKPFVDLYPDCR